MVHTVAAQHKPSKVDASIFFFFFFFSSEIHKLLVPLSNGTPNSTRGAHGHLRAAFVEKKHLATFQACTPLHLRHLPKICPYIFYFLMEIRRKKMGYSRFQETRASKLNLMPLILEQKILSKRSKSETSQHCNNFVQLCS